MLSKSRPTELNTLSNWQWSWPICCCLTHFVWQILMRIAWCIVMRIVWQVLMKNMWQAGWKKLSWRCLLRLRSTAPSLSKVVASSTGWFCISNTSQPVNMIDTMIRHTIMSNPKVVVARKWSSLEAKEGRIGWWSWTSGRRNGIFWQRVFHIISRHTFLQVQPQQIDNWKEVASVRQGEIMIDSLTRL